MGDLNPEELVVGVGHPGALSEEATGLLTSHGVAPVGIVRAAAEVKARMTKDLGLAE